MPISESSQQERLVALLLACSTLAWLAACNVFDARSGALRCSGASDCSADRACESGFCVVRSELLPDADADPNDPDAGPCSLLPLIDDFEDGLAAPLWNKSDTAQVSIVESGGVLTISNTVLPANPVTVSYKSVIRDYDLTNSAFAIEIPSMVNTASKADVKLIIGSGNSNQIEFRQVTGSLTITLSYGGNTNLGNLSYDAVAHRWWRVVASGGGTLHAQTSADGTTWTTHGTAPTPAVFNAVGVDLEMRAFKNGIAPGSLVFDNANVGVSCEP